MTKHVYCHPLTRWLRDLVGRVCWGWSALAAGNDMAKWFVWAGPSGCQSCAGTTDILHGEQIANMSNFVTKCGRKILHSGKVLPQMGKLVAFTTLQLYIFTISDGLCNWGVFVTSPINVTKLPTSLARFLI